MLCYGKKMKELLLYARTAAGIGVAGSPLKNFTKQNRKKRPAEALLRFMFCCFLAGWL